MGKYLDMVRAFENTPPPRPINPENRLLGFLGADHENSSPLDTHSESIIRWWLTRIEETDSEVIIEVIRRAKSSFEAKIYFLGRASEGNTSDQVPRLKPCLSVFPT